MDKISVAVEKYRDLIFRAERFLWAHPETGYKEFKSNEYMIEQFRSLGYDLTLAEGITGFYTVIDTGREGPEVMILGELDSIICPTHKEADPVTGAVHSCGHHAQGATLIGIAAALKEEGMLDTLCGRIRLCAVPAEELLEIEYRSELKKEGKIKYFGGKTEFLSRGYFDGVDIALMIHTSQSNRYGVCAGHIGCVVKTIIYKGKSAHAGGDPHAGINALYAANCGLNAINALRETFREPDLIRVHPIVTSGGDMVNAIPEVVKLESYVRGANFDAILKENRKVNRALVGAALSLGAHIDIRDFCGYAPECNNPNLSDVFVEAVRCVMPEEKISKSQQLSTGCSDMGDLSCIMPTVQPFSPGATGISHGNNYYVIDPERACVGSAKIQIAMLFLLLQNNASRAREIIDGFKPRFSSAKEYLAFVDSISTSGERITYEEDGATVKF